ncbi:MAG: hypothetical protein RH917_15850 [Lacipirellulaceae bacterium]
MSCHLARALDFFVRLSAVVVLITIVGCGDSTGRREVSGTVTYAGQPLEEGRLSLRPLGQGPSSGCEIRDGEFYIPSQKGPKPGEYKVSIQAYQETGRMIASATNPREKVAEVANKLPNKYAFNSELRMNVASDGENVFEFKLD